MQNRSSLAFLGRRSNGYRRNRGRVLQRSKADLSAFHCWYYTTRGPQINETERLKKRKRGVHTFDHASCTMASVSENNESPFEIEYFGTFHPR